MNEKKACSRCGIEREARKDSRLCRDCVSVLSESQRVMWRAEKRVAA